MRLALQKQPLLGGHAIDTTAPPATPVAALTQPATPSAASAGVDERVFMLVIGLAIAACAGLIAGGHGLVSTISAQPIRVATLLALTVALQMFSVQIYGRGSLSGSAIGILAS